MPPSRWDFLFDTRSVPLTEFALDEVAKRLAQELRSWPPPVEELDLATGRKFASLFEPEAPRPPEAVYAEAFRMADWELGRNVEAVDDYMRNHRYVDHGLALFHAQAILFVSRWLVEQWLSLSEATEGRIKRPQLREGLARTQRLFNAGK